MLRSLYTAGTSMLVQRLKMDVISNNIANAETAGYKQDRLISRSFSDMLISRINDPNILYTRKEVGPHNTGIHVDEVFTDFDQGNMEPTRRLTDIALVGPGFYVVETPQGERYTRDGGFNIDGNGFLTTMDGHYVLGEGGRINVGQGVFSVDESGNVAVDDVIVNRIRVVDFANYETLRKEGSNLYTSTAGPQAAGGEVKLMQGFLEGSNVDIARTMTDMMEVNRAYETNQRMVKMIDESLSKTVNEVGRV